MKRMILGVAVLVMFGMSSALMAQAPAAPAAPPARGGPAARGGARGGRGFAPVVIGPAAPVPPQVAMLRPSTEEMAQMKSAIKQFIDSDKSPTASLFKKYESVLNIDGPRLNTAATYTQTQQRMGPRHEAFVEQAKAGNIDLLLDGDSITDLWGDGRDAAKKATYDKYFGAYKTANFAISGDTTQGVLWGLHNGEGQGFAPKAIMLMIGTNNMGGNTPAEIAEGVGAVVLEMRKDFPNAKILLLAIFTRGFPGDPMRDRIVECNKIIQKLDDQQHIFYMDIGAKFLAADGTLDAVMPDRLHPNAEGYEIWGTAVKDKLAELMK